MEGRINSAADVTLRDPKTHIRSKPFVTFLNKCIMMASKRRKMDGSSESYGSEQEESSREQVGRIMPSIRISLSGWKQGSVASDVSAAEYAGRSAPTSVIPDLDPGLLRTFADNIEALKKENTELQGKLRAAHASQIPAQLGGHLASLVTMARTNQTTSKSQRTAAWQSLMEKALPQLVHANGLEALLTPLSIESEEEMIAGKETLTEGLAEWKKAPMGLANRLIGPEGRSSALSEWLPNVKAEDYNAAYSFDAVQLLLTTLSCRISVTQFKWGAQNPPANPHLPSRPLTAALGSHHLTMLGPVALSTTTDGLLDTSSVRWTAWRSRIKEAVDGGAQVIVSCAQLTISATIAPQEPDSVSSATGAAASSSSWFALQLDLLNKDCRVYRCSRDVSRSSVQTVSTSACPSGRLGRLLLIQTCRFLTALLRAWNSPTQDSGKSLLTTL